MKGVLILVGARCRQSVICQHTDEGQVQSHLTSLVGGFCALGRLALSAIVSGRLRVIGQHSRGELHPYFVNGVWELTDSEDA